MRFDRVLGVWVPKPQAEAEAAQRREPAVRPPLGPIPANAVVCARDSPVKPARDEQGGRPRETPGMDTVKRRRRRRPVSPRAHACCSR